MEVRDRPGVRFAWYAAVVVFTVGYLSYNFRLHRADLSAPLTPAQGDPAALLSLVTAIKEGGWPWTVDRAGAPGVAERLDYPVPEHAHALALRLMLQFTDNPFLVYNLWGLLSYPLTAVFTFGVLRALGVSRPVGFATAVLYTFLPFHAWRVFVHTYLAHYHTVPLIALPVIWILQGRLPFFGPDRRMATTGWALVIAVLVATTSAYYAYFGCFFLAVAGAYRGFVDKSWRPLASGLLTAAVLVGVGFACTLPFVLYQREHGANPAVAHREAAESELFGLKVPQLVLPAEKHRVNALGHVTRVYNAYSRALENRDSTLGVVGAAGFFILLGRLLMPKAGVTLLGGLALMNAAALLLGMSGGLGTLFNFAVFPQMRCYNRICVFVAFWDLLAVALLVDRWTNRRWRPWAALGLLALGLWDQTSPTQAPRHSEIRAAHEAWRGFVDRMEESLPPGGMVFQLPAVPYPEGSRVHEMWDYAHLKCHSYSRTLRWSYGTNRNRRWAEWHRYVAGLPTPEMVRALGAAGFAGVYVDRRGYEDNGAAVVAELRAVLGKEIVTSDDGGQLLFAMIEPGDSVADRDRLLNRPCVLLQTGFFPWAVNAPRRRAMHAAEMRLVNPDDRVRRVTLAMNWERHGPRDLEIRVTGPGIDRLDRPPAERGPFRLDLDLPPGEHVLRFDATPRPPGPARFYTAWDAADIRLTERE